MQAADLHPSPSRSHWKRTLRWILVLAVAVPACWGGYVAFWRYHLKRFQAVEPGVLYRSAQPTELALWWVAHRHGVRTVVSLQLHDFRLYRGLFDFGAPDGEKESIYTQSLGLKHVQWPMGDEQCWPWPDAWELEEFFHLVDDPANRPVLIHCMGGRHRTGTFSALYRMEYDRWTPEKALAEMYGFEFGHRIPSQEHNLRTYYPRPLPSDEQWKTLAAAFQVDPAMPPARAVPELVLRIRNDEPDGMLQRAFAQYLAEGRTFGLELALRVLRNEKDFTSLSLIESARRTLKEHLYNNLSELTAAASIVADFGSPEDQHALVERLWQESDSPEPTAAYEALVVGVTNRYTANRLAYLRPLLDDDRLRSGVNTSSFKYCDTATYRFAAITGELPVLKWLEEQMLDEGRKRAIAWLDSNPEAAKVSRLLPPGGRRTAMAGEASTTEDLSKMRR